ncbi:4-hydroxy-tetrahydrodipicolinate synthase [Priestia filamentosa]|uniref:4-hydroxy-tetrahydrodipicolinate synthase n=1 Tax=Priestia filamentosa TaxID=1402861 RepID=UPI0005891DEA
MINFGRIQTAMITPFTKDLDVDYEAVTNLVNHLIKNGSDSIVVAGTTGESPTLTSEEKLFLFSHVKDVAGDRAKVIANVGSNDTLSSVQFAREVSRQGKVDALMLVNPYYNKPSQKGLYRHFKTIAESTKLPIMLYNIQGRTAVNTTAETIIELSKIPNIVAVKESSGDLSQIATIVEGTPSDFHVYSGDDNLTLPILSVGGSGVVSVASHVVGNEMKQMIDAFFSGDVVRAGQWHRALLPIFEGMFFTTNPVPVKAVLREMGLNKGSVRLPIVDIEEDEVSEVKKLMTMIESITVK